MRYVYMPRMRCCYTAFTKRSLRVSQYLKNLLCGVALASSAFVAASPFGPIAQANPTEEKQTTRAFGRIESSFLENKGQWDRNALMLTRSEGLDFWVTRDGIVLDTYQNVNQGGNALTEAIDGTAAGTPNFRQGHVLKLSFVGGTPAKSYVGSNPISTRVDYVGLTTKNVTDVKAYGEATVNGVLPGVNVRYYRDQNQPRYDLILAPGVNAGSIALEVQGAEDVLVSPDGTLNIRTTLGWVRKSDLFVYQNSGSSRTPVESAFSVSEKGGRYYISFELGKYDTSRPVIIDPIVYGTHFGGDSNADEVMHATSDGAGNTYFTGWTVSTDLPVVIGPYGVELKDSVDGFFAQLTGDIYDAVYVAYVGSGFDDIGKYVDVDQYGNVWMAGTTFADRFPGRLNVTVGVPVTDPPTLAPWGGTFAYTYGGLRTADLAYNVNAAQTKAALDALANAPAGGFTVDPVDVNGNLLPIATRMPIANMRIRSNDPSAGALRLVLGRRPYVVVDALGGNAPSANQILGVDFTAFGFSPRAGTFTLGLNENGTVTNTAGIRFDANGAEVQAALRLLQPLTGAAPARVTAVGGRLVFPLTEPVNAGIPVPINFFDTASAPQARPFLIPNFTGVTYGTYAFLNLAPHTFLTLFKKTPTGLVAADETTAPGTTRLISGITAPAVNPALLPTPAFLNNAITGLAIRRITTATGNVEIAVAGNAATDIRVLPGDGASLPVAIPGTKPTGARFGYFVTFTYNNATGAISVDNNRSKYIGGIGRTTVNGLAMDAEGSLYLGGAVERLLPTGFATNVVLNPASTTFATTPGGFPNSSLLRFKDGWVRKYDPSGTMLISSVIGGSQMDAVEGISIDPSNNIYLLSRTNSFNFPRTVNAFSEIFPGGGSLLAVTKLNSTGSTIVYSSSLAASVRSVDDITPPFIPNVNARFDQYDLAVDQKGNAYISGLVTRPLIGPIPMVLTPAAPIVTDQLPALDNVMPNGDTEGFLTVLNSTGSALLFSSVVGSSASADYVNNLSIDRTGAVYIAGASFVTAIGPVGLPVNFLSPFAFKAFPDGYDGWLAKLKIIQPILAAIGLNPIDVAGGLGSTSSVQVLLQRPAPVGGATVTLRISNPSVARFNNAVSGPTNIRVTIPQGQQLFTAPVTVFTRLVSNPTFVDIRAELDGDFLQTRLNVRPWMESFTLGSTQVAGGESINGTVTIFQDSPAAGIDVTLSSDNPLVSFPGGDTITIAPGDRSATFEIATSGVDVVTDVNITAAVAGVGITQTLQLTPPLLETINISPDRVTGGESTNATVQVQGVAGANTFATISATGSPVTITLPGDTNPTTLPALVQIPQGQNQVTFAVNTSFVASNTSAIVTATLNGESASDTLFIENNSIVSITLSANPVTGGTLVNGTVTVGRPAGLTGMVIPLTNSNPTAGTVSPMIVNIAPGATTGSFTVQTNPSSTPQSMTIATAKPGYVNRSVVLTIDPFIVNFNLTLTPPQITGGATGLGTISLGAPAPIDLVFTLSSTNPLASFPNGATVTIPSGSLSVNFPISTGITPATTDVTITASLFGTGTSQILRIFPPAVQSFFVSPSVVTAGTATTGFLTLDQPAPAGGLVVNLTSNNPAFVGHPASIIVPAGSSTANFPISTFQVTRQITVRFTATVPARGQSLEAILTINPSP